MDDNQKTILALYPNRYGIGYALFNSPEELIEYGLSNVKAVNHKKTIKKIKEYISYFKPDVVVTRNINDLKKRKSKRIQKLIDAICFEARLQGLDIYSYSRGQIKETFKQFKACSKYQISLKVMEWFPELKHHAYPKRKDWMTENYNAGIFDAVSLAVVFWYLEEAK